MSTPQQISANRQNARRSTGPATARGKQNIQVNALRHGLTGRTVVLPSDDLDLYRAHVKAVAASLNPEGPEETQLAALIADNYWRLQRIATIEDGIFAMQFAGADTLSNHPHADAALRQAQAYLAHSRELERLTLYQQRILRANKLAAARLEQLQAARRPAPAAAAAPRSASAAPPVGPQPPNSSGLYDAAPPAKKQTPPGTLVHPAASASNRL